MLVSPNWGPQALELFNTTKCTFVPAPLHLTFANRPSSFPEVILQGNARDKVYLIRCLVQDWWMCAWGISSRDWRGNLRGGRKACGTLISVPLGILLMRHCLVIAHTSPRSSESTPSHTVSHRYGCGWLAERQDVSLQQAVAHSPSSRSILCGSERLLLSGCRRLMHTTAPTASGL